MDHRPKYKKQTYKLQEENIAENPFDLEIGKEFLDAIGKKKKNGPQNKLINQAYFKTFAL